MRILKVTYFFYFLGISVFGNTQTGANPFLLKGYITERKDGVLYIVYTGGDNKPVKDSAFVRQGSFSFKGYINETGMANLLFFDKSANKNYSTDIWIEAKKMKIKINDKEFKNVSFKGSLINNEYKRFKKIKQTVSEKYQKQLDSLKGLRDIEQISAIRARLGSYFSELENHEIEFFYKHPQSHITAYMLRYYLSKISLDTLKKFYNRLGQKVQHTSYGQYLNNKIIQLNNGSPGSQAKNFITRDINGNSISLSDFKGTYVLLEFWASWCIPCRKEHPELIELYRKYKTNHIQFIGIADDDEQKDKWAKAIEKDNIPWLQLLRGGKTDTIMKRDGNNQDINELFGIQSLPTLILIDAKGIIIGRYEENIIELKKILEKIFY